MKSHLPYSPDLSPTDYHFFKHLDNFLQGKRFHNQQEAENAFHEFIESWRTSFHTTGINKPKLAFIGKNVLIVMVPILINKDMFEPSYNDLKFTIWNGNYVCSNLVRNRCLVCVGVRVPARLWHRVAAVVRQCHALRRTVVERDHAALVPRCVPTALRFCMFGFSLALSERKKVCYAIHVKLPQRGKSVGNTGLDSNKP